MDDHAQAAKHLSSSIDYEALGIGERSEPLCANPSHGPDCCGRSPVANVERDPDGHMGAGRE